MKSSVKEFILLVAIYFKVKVINFTEYLRVVFRYYPNILFFKIDASLLLSYFFTNPYRVSKLYLLQKGERDVYTYGETPLTTLDNVSHICGLTASDVVFELGCGRGRTCFWLNQFIGCCVVGIDFVPLFIEKGQKVKEQFQVEGVEFRLEDLLQADLRGATVIYLYGTCLSASQIDRLIDRFCRLPEGTKIITVSYALTDYQPEAPFFIKKQFGARFTWGSATVTLQIKGRRKNERQSR